MDIREFIAARLDEREAKARAAAEADPAPWTADAIDNGDAGTRDGHGFGIVVADDGIPLWECEGSRTLMMTAPTARHVAAHDPARVLADVAFKRQILADNPPLPDYTEAELHAYSMHPEWEYATTEGQRKAWDRVDVPPDGEGWERNTDKGRDGWERLDFTEESYWRRRLPPEQVQARSEPRVLRLLAAIDSDHPDFNPAWKLEA